jgi:hypothetical protein
VVNEVSYPSLSLIRVLTISVVTIISLGFVLCKASRLNIVAVVSRTDCRKGLAGGRHTQPPSVRGPSSQPAVNFFLLLH